MHTRLSAPAIPTRYGGTRPDPTEGMRPNASSRPAIDRPRKNKMTVTKMNGTAVLQPGVDT